MKSWTGLGLMSGTSADGLDIACCRFEQTDDGNWKWEILAAETYPWNDEWKDKLLSAFAGSAVELARIDVDFAKECRRLIRNFCADKDVRPQFAASHGHTIFHRPELQFTWQAGSGEAMVAELGFPVVTNFRQKNMMLGGQGAPLVPFGERRLFPEVKAFLNLGGIANVSVGGKGWDVCICNMALNFLAGRLQNRAYDEDGKLAAGGAVIPELLERLRSLDYYSDPPPKSLGREWFADQWYPLLTDPGHKPEDLLRTCTEHITSQIAGDLRAAGMNKGNLLVTGGGAKNKFLMNVLQQKLSIEGIGIEEAGNPLLIDYKEALIFAFLGLHVLLGKTNISAKATGATEDILGGSIHLPADGWKLPLI